MPGLAAGGMRSLPRISSQNCRFHSAWSAIGAWGKCHWPEVTHVVRIHPRFKVFRVAIE